jgi:hypothetical protein
VAEYAEQAVWHVLEELSGVPRDRLPEPGEIRFGQAEPYCVRWETGEDPEPEFGENISPVIARLTTVLASRVWWKRSVPVALTNTDGDPMVLIDATVTVSGDVAERLSARSDFDLRPRHAATILCGSRSGTAQAAGCGILVQ